MAAVAYLPWFPLIFACTVSLFLSARQSKRYDIVTTEMTALGPPTNIFHNFSNDEYVLYEDLR